MVPPSLREKVQEFGFLAKVAMLAVLQATPMDLSEAATWWAARNLCLLLTTGAAGVEVGTFISRFSR